MRDEVLTEGTLTQSSTKPHAAPLLPTLRTAELTTISAFGSLRGHWEFSRPSGVELL